MGVLADGRGGEFAAGRREANPASRHRVRNAPTGALTALAVKLLAPYGAVKLLASPQ